MHQYRSRPKDIYETLRWRGRLGFAFVSARLHRMRLSQTTFIGITGSAGKTTTKNLSNLILSAFHPVIVTEGSMNTPIIIAETLLATEKRHQFCILEIGAFKAGALDLPMRLFTPGIGVLINMKKITLGLSKARVLTESLPRRRS